MTAAAALQDQGNSATDSRTRSALAAARLILEETNEAVSLLEDAVKADPANPAVLNDLAAAYLVRAARESRPDDLRTALQNSTKAIALAPTSKEALYNRAIACEGLGLRKEALEAWQAFLAVEDDPGWRGEADRRLQALRNPEK